MPNCSGDQLDGLSERPWPMARSREVAHLDLGPGRATEKFEKKHCDDDRGGPSMDVKPAG
jgi:hypothetical protein